MSIGTELYEQLESWLIDEIECDSEAEHNCSVVAKWRCLSTCDQGQSFWCQNRKSKHDKQGYICAHCRRPTDACWKISQL